MTLKEQVEVNKEIQKLIRSKYIDSFPVGYNTPESRYYGRLEADIAKAEHYESVESSRV